MNAGAVYSIACDLFQALIGAFYLADELSGEALDRADWFFAAGDLAVWLGDEKYRSGDLERLHGHALIDVGDAYIHRVWDAFGDASQWAHSEYDSLETGTWFYFFYCTWFVRVSDEFDRLMSEELIRNTSFFHTYRSNKHRFDTVVAQLTDEVPDLRAVPQSKRDRLQARLDHLGTQLAGEWRTTVFDIYHRS